MILIRIVNTKLGLSKIVDATLYTKEQMIKLYEFYKNVGFELYVEKGIEILVERGRK